MSLFNQSFVYRPVSQQEFSSILFSINYKTVFPPPVFKEKDPKNSKYQHVKTRLDTGESWRDRFNQKMNLRNYRYRNDEIFKRLKVTTFAQLILQVASVSELNASVNESESSTPEGTRQLVPKNIEVFVDMALPSCLPVPVCVCVCVCVCLCVLSVISGVGERTVDQSPDPGFSADSDRPYPDCPYLLLDVRDREQYESCHIISAHSFPIASLSRTMNPYTKEVLQYKNAPGKIIIVYDEDERTASQAATTMCQRGFENLFMLSGGLKVIGQKFPGSLVTGPLPPQCVSPSESARGRRTAPPAVHTQTEQRWRFTADELGRLQEQFDETVLPSSNSSSERTTQGRHISSSFYFLVRFAPSLQQPQLSRDRLDILKGTMLRSRGFFSLT
uniref:Centrosomal protein 41 n=1 Tax=Neogobius melanostomus TaxID=47308 RepID=A0A8C6TK02_9GOBI